MRCLQTGDSEDVDRGARVMLGDEDWDYLQDEDKDFSRESAVAVLTQFDVMVTQEIEDEEI